MGNIISKNLLLSAWAKKRPKVHRSALFDGLASSHIEQGTPNCQACMSNKSEFELYSELAR